MVYTVLISVTVATGEGVDSLEMLVVGQLVTVSTSPGTPVYMVPHASNEVEDEQYVVKVDTVSVTVFVTIEALGLVEEPVISEEALDMTLDEREVAG